MYGRLVKDNFFQNQTSLFITKLCLVEIEKDERMQVGDLFTKEADECEV